MTDTESRAWRVFPVWLSNKTIEALRREAERRETTPSALLRAVDCLGAVELGAGDLVSAWPEGSFKPIRKKAA